MSHCKDEKEKLRLPDWDEETELTAEAERLSSQSAIWVTDAPV